jgi:hypothetical protein
MHVPFAGARRGTGGALAEATPVTSCGSPLGSTGKPEAGRIIWWEEEYAGRSDSCC